MLEPRPINDDVFLEERKKTNQYKNKKITQTIYRNTPLTTQDKQGAKAF